MKTLAKLLLLTTLTLSSSAFAMKTIDLVDKAQMTDQQKMDLAQKLAEKQDWKAVFEIMYPLALEGNLQAQSNLGMLYNLGRGVDENKELAYWWFSEAAERGSIKAINNLAVMYFNGKLMNHTLRHLRITMNITITAKAIGLNSTRTDNTFTNSSTWLARCCL